MIVTVDEETGEFTETDQFYDAAYCEDLYPNFEPDIINKEDISSGWVCPDMKGKDIELL